MLLQQIGCETAAQCEQIAATQQALVLDGIVAVVLLVVVWTAVRHARSRGLINGNGG